MRLGAGIATIDEETRTVFRNFDNDLAQLSVTSLHFTALLETTFTQPVIYPKRQRIDPDPDHAEVCRQLLAALAAVSDSMEVVSGVTSGEERDRLVDEMGKAFSILRRQLVETQNLMEPVEKLH